jgi:para-aminobenzoate synthetase component 1
LSNEHVNSENELLNRGPMLSIDISSDKLVSSLLDTGREAGLCLLDSCGTEHAHSRLLIAGVNPVNRLQLSDPDRNEALDLLDEILSGKLCAIFTLSYDLGRKLHGVGPPNSNELTHEPDIFVSLFDALLVHDYSTGKTTLTGNEKRFADVQAIINRKRNSGKESDSGALSVNSNFTKAGYHAAIETIKDQIRQGNTYQTNLTQKLTADLPPLLSTQSIFERLRRDHPAPFAAVLERGSSTVISASPERFFKVDGRTISASPIKGTRPRGTDRASDERMRSELLESEKDRAENTMIVDLLRNDLGRVCEFGSVKVKQLCRLQELPTVFHLVSDIEGTLSSDVRPSEVIEALFPCGSITGAPKRRTMQIIEDLEKEPRGLSMGAIGVYVPEEGFELPGMLDLSVAIRTMVIRGNIATFNVGGGIVIDSDPQMEYDESIVKARALLSALAVDDKFERSV